ncbi:MAG: methyltransferase [Patescibacteria group bacterium]
METVLWIIFLVVLSSAAIAGFSAAPWLPTKPSQRKHLLDNLQLKDGQTVVDLGCGDGSMLFAVARLYPNVVCIGYDISLLPLFIAWVRKFLFFRAYRNVHIRFGNLFTQNIRQANVVFIFLLSKCYPKLLTTLPKQVSPQAQLIVEAWPLPDIEPRQTLKGENLLPVYIYSGEDLPRKP